VKTRVTDQFLGFTCREDNPESGVVCRAFAPAADSRKFDTRRGFRCVDIAVIDTEQGIALSRLTEWAAPSQQCDFARPNALPNMEVNFARGEVCAGGMCMAADQLSGVGRLRLQRLIRTALEEFGLGMTVAVRRG
jgi:hypothetical protein